MSKDYKIISHENVYHCNDLLSPSDYTNVSIPKILYEKVHQRIEGTGFTSVSRFVVFILRELVMEPKKGEAPFTDQEKKKLLEKLKKLGYI